jgi:hypothetical protein
MSAKISNPGSVVGTDVRRACADQPTWQWFALPFIRRTDNDDDSGPEGDDPRVRRAGHERALMTCANCPLALTCLQAAWRTEEFGTYGAVSEVERFMLGGRGRAASRRTYARYEKALRRVTKRYGSEHHPVVRWIVAQGLPSGLTAPAPVEEQGAA